MIISSYSNIDIIQGVVGYGDTEGITDWRILNTSNGNFNILNSTSSNVNISILENGNVGIGTLTPVSALDINGNLNINGNYTKNSRDVVNDTSNYVLSTSNILVNRITSLPATGGSSQWTTGATNFIYYNTSNVGIGATNPSSKLHIYDDILSSTRLIIQNNNAASLISSTLNISSSPVAPLSGSVGNDLYYIYTTGTYTLTIPTGGATCDILMIGGGGGGGHNCAGGGGSGACIVAINQTINAGNYTISVGAGGPGAAVNSSANGTNGGDSSIGSLYVAKGGGFGGGQRGGLIGGTGGSGGGAAGGSVPATNSSRSSTNVVNGSTNISPSTTSTYAVLGNIGGSSAGYTFPNYDQLNGAGGGGIGVAGTNSSISACGPGGNGIYQVIINSTTYNLRSYFTNNGTFGVQDGSTGNYYIGGGGAGAGNQSSGAITISGGLGGGGNAYDTSSISGIAGTQNTGSGGGGGTGNTAKGGDGGSGLIIIRFKIINGVINNSLGALTDNTSSSDTDISTTTTLNKSTIQANMLSSFIFLQRGKYKIRAGFDRPNNILYSELIIYDNTTNNIVYRYGDTNQSYIIDITDGKFYKLAFRYIYCNFTNDNIILSSFQIYCDNQMLNLTNYLFGGVNINIDYRNNYRTIMNLFANVKYEGNNNTSYKEVRDHLDAINFFNINALKIESKRTKDYMDTGLDAIIRASYATDANIININSFINKINKLISSNNAINYISELPTYTRSIYKDATIEEIFGKNYERLVTKERVSNYSEISDTKTIRPKKIYVEAVA